MIPPLDECIADLNFTNADIRRLEAIVPNLEEFIMDSGGEDRSACKMDLLRYRAYLDQAKGLRLRIEHYIELHNQSALASTEASK